MPKRILVVGAGIIGVCVAHYAVRKGHQVTVVDSKSADHEGCSFGNAGMIVPSHFVPMASPTNLKLGLKWMMSRSSPFHIKPRVDWNLIVWMWKFFSAASHRHVNACAPILRDLHNASRRCYEDISEQLENVFKLSQQGLLMLCATHAGLEEETKGAEHARRLGVAADVLTPTEVSKLEPAMKFSATGGVFYPNDCHMDSELFMSSMKTNLQSEGVDFAWDQSVRGMHVQNNRVNMVFTSEGEFEADEVVVCAGVESPTVLRTLEIDLSMQAGKGYSLTLPRQTGMPGICAILSEARVAMTPLGDRIRFGGTMEIAGVNHDISSRRLDAIKRSVMRYCPEITPDDFKDLTPWCGLRPCSPDGMPYIGRIKPYSNVLVATGHGMMGVSLAPITGKLMAEILSDEETSYPLDRLSPNR